MHRIFLILLIVFFSNSFLQAQAVVLERTAELMDEGYPIDGTAFLEELDNGDLQLRLSSDFSTPFGPDVRIFLNNSLAATGGVEIVNLSDIGHFNGAITFDVPDGVGIEDYDYIVFYCFQFSQLWASGEWGDTTPPGGGFECLESDITLTNGTGVVDICPSDDIPDVLTFINSLDLPANTHYAYLITDENEILQEVISGDSYDFEGSLIDEQRVYGIHFDGTLQPAIGSIRTATSATGCYTHSSILEYVEITKNACPPPFECLASSTFTNGGTTSLDICPSDGMSDQISLLNSLSLDPGEHYAYLITDANELLTDVVYNSSFDFEGSSDMEQRIYGIHFDGNLNPVFGTDRSITSASGCFTHSDAENYLTVTKNACPPSFVCEESSTSSNSENTIDICASDGIGDIIELTNSINSEAGDNYAYLITDSDEILLEVVIETTYNFEGSGEETQRVYGIHFDGDLMAQIGENRLSTTASECYEHSDSDIYLTVTKNACPPQFECEVTDVSGIDTQNMFDICPSDDTDDIITLQNNLSIEAGMHYAYLITDAQEIVKAYTMTDEYNFEGSGDEEDRVYGIHFDGDLNVEIGENRMETTASGCYEHSSDSEYLTITKNACPPPFVCETTGVSGIDAQNMYDICPSDGTDDIITLQNNLSIEAGMHYAYLITDAQEVVKAYTMTDEFNFEGSGDEEDRVYGIHFDGDLNVEIGENRMLTTASGCYEHSSNSEYLTITKNACPPPFECINTYTATTAWSLVEDICATDGESNVIPLLNNQMIEDMEHYTYLITDENEVVQSYTSEHSFDFEGSGDQTQRVYGIHYDGELNVVVGENRLMTTASGCFTHSSSALFLTITKNACPSNYECRESLTATTDWATEVEICPTDGFTDVIELRNNIMEAAGEHYAYLITDANEILQEVVFDSEYDFEGSPLIQQRVYGINFDGDLNPKVGEHRLETEATGCFIHSGESFFLTINKTGCINDFECVESLTASFAWVTDIDICGSDGIPDEIFIQNNISTDPGEHYAFLLTDKDEILLEVFFDSIYNFEGLEEDEYRVYGLSYAGQLEPAIGEDRHNTTATDCYIHSGGNLYITVYTMAECVVSTEEIEPEGHINIFPNPTSGLMNFEYKGSDPLIDASIYNSQGQKIASLKNRENMTIQNPGIYILQLITESKNVYTERFVVID
ncbi:MAG: T9SS type A sorting domain-containing protein [Bacteroidota bacterium]